MRNAFTSLMATLFLLGLVNVPLGCLAEPVFIDGGVIRVVHGDTVTLQDDHEDVHKIRLAAIDAPESWMPFGQQARTYLNGLVLGKQVKARVHKKDLYGCTIATLFLQGQDVNLTLVQAGLAWHYKRYAKEQSIQYVVLYANAGRMVRFQKNELWRGMDPTAPWDWRVQNKGGRRLAGEDIMHPK